MKISFPHLGNYCLPIEILLKLLFTSHEIMPPPPITKKTLELGSKYSPEFVCLPFKYNLGNFIEALDNGAQVLIQGGGGCRFGYYPELQEQILVDLGYKFTFINIFSSDELNPFKIFKACKKIDSKITFNKFVYYALLTLKMIKLMDKLEFFIRENIGFEKYKNSFSAVQKCFFDDLKMVKNFRELNGIGDYYEKKLKSLEVEKPDNVLKVGIIGELYSLMEPFANYFLEKELAQNKIQITRFTNASYLLLGNKKSSNKCLKDASGYLKYALGADGTQSVARCKNLAELNYDGIIHVKPFGCTPEVNAIPVLMNLNKDYKIPILYFSFDVATSETGIKTRLEAFYDMLEIKKRKQECRKFI